MAVWMLSYQGGLFGPKNAETWLVLLYNVLILKSGLQHGKKDVVRALLHEGSDPGVLDESQDTAVDLIASPEMRQVFADVLMQSAASGE